MTRGGSAPGHLWSLTEAGELGEGNVFPVLSISHRPRRAAGGSPRSLGDLQGPADHSGDEQTLQERPGLRSRNCLKMTEKSRKQIQPLGRVCRVRSPGQTKLSDPPPEGQVRGLWGRWEQGAPRFPALTG